MSINLKKQSQHGFSLIQVSMIVAVAGILLASVIPGGDLGSTIEKDQITRDRMEKIEEATKNFMAANLRRPCPADGTLAIGNINFGLEDTTPGRCSGANFYTQSTPLTKTGATTTASSAVATTLSNTTGLAIGMLVTGTNIATDTHIASVDSATQITLDKYPTGASGTLTFTSVAAGVVPTKTLGLPDEYMFDGYRRRIGYIVDIRATDRTTCRDMQVTKTSGNIQIMDSAASTAATDNVMWSLISYGKNGHGAFPMQGSSIANRINSGASNDDEEVNAFINTAGTFATAFTQKLVKHEPVATAGATYFDDFVWTQEATKNTCCTGKMCNLGTRIDGVLDEPIGTTVIGGDINGDGISDLILSEPTNNRVHVVFGRATGWTPNGALSLGTANSSRFITITNNSAHPNFVQNNDASIKAGDLNGDGYDDIVMGYGDGSSSAVKVFYGSATPVDTNTSAMTNIITFPSTTGSGAPSIVLGNFSSTAHKDILALIKTASGVGLSTAYVIYGAASYAHTAEDDTTLATTVGFKIDTTTGRLLSVSGAGDLNNDGYDEILISSYTTGNLYVLFGQSPADWDADKTVSASAPTTPDTINIDTRVSTGVTQAIKFTNGDTTNIGRYGIEVADMDGDGTYKDIIFNNGDYYHVYYGKTAASWTSPDITTAANYDGTNGFRVDVVTTQPSWAGNIEDIMAGDVNGDGKIDLLFTDYQADANSLTNSGSIFTLLQPSSGWSSIWSSGTIRLFDNNGRIFDANGLPLNNDTSKAFRIDGAYADDGLAVSLISDINNDGKLDIIAEVADNVNSAPGYGNTYIYFGKTLVPWDASNNISQLNRF